MGIIKSTQYSIWCDGDNCDELIDFAEIRSPKRYFEAQGYELINGKWYCAKCAKKIQGV